MTGYESKKAMARDKLLELAQEGISMHSHDAPEYIVCEALIGALAQPAQEPVFLFQSHRDNFWCVDLTCKKCYSADFRLMHTHPPQRPWVGLTDADWKEIEDMPDTFDQGVAWAQAKLKEKNNG
jgi:hypothetical protein